MSKPTQKKKNPSKAAPAGEEPKEEVREETAQGSSSKAKKTKKGKSGAGASAKAKKAAKSKSKSKAKSRSSKADAPPAEETPQEKKEKKEKKKPPSQEAAKDGGAGAESSPSAGRGEAPADPGAPAPPAEPAGDPEKAGEGKAAPAGEESREAGPAPTEPEGFTQGLSARTLRVLEAARAIKDRLGHGAVTTGHLIAAILEEEAGIARDVFWDINAYPDMFVEEMARIKEIPPPETGWWFDEKTELVLERARDGAEALGAREVEPEHLALALLSLPEGHAAEILEEFSMDREDLKAEILAHMGIPVEECPDWEHETKREKSRRIRKQKARK